MEENWIKISDVVGDRWFDKNDRLRKAFYRASKLTSYYDERGEYHRLDGPAHTFRCRQYWYYHGKEIEVSSQEEFERYLKLKAFW
jgi:hypothetical protein